VSKASAAMSNKLSSVPFFSRPMSASSRDVQIGEDELGNPVYKSRIGKKYTVSPSPDQRTPNRKLKDMAKALGDAALNYAKDPKLPTVAQIKSIPSHVTNALNGEYLTIRDAINGNATYGDVFGIALDTAGAGGVVGKAPADSVGMFLGVTAKGANLRTLKIAKKARASGVDDQKIWRNTKWFMDPADGQWKYEISDQGLKGTMQPSQYTNDVQSFRGSFSHPELEKAASDQIDRTTVERGGNRGAMTPQGIYRGIRLGVDVVGKESERSTLAHEVQHVLQSDSNFGKGSNHISAEAKARAIELAKAPQPFKAEVGKINSEKLLLLSKRHKELEKELGSKVEHNSKSDPSVSSPDSIGRFYSGLSGEARAKVESVFGLPKDFFDPNNYSKKTFERKLDAYYGIHPAIRNLDISPFSQGPNHFGTHWAYWTKAGEVESRNVENRLNNPSLMGTHPLKTRDVAPSLIWNNPTDKVDYKKALKELQGYLAESKK